MVDPRVITYYDERFYCIGEGKEAKYYPSVTTKLGILPPTFIARWRGDVGNREADARLSESQERGKRIHKAWDTICTGGLVIYSNWQNPVDPKVIEEAEAKYQ